MYHNYSYLIWNFNVSSHWIWIYKQHVESSICDQAMPFAVKPKTIMPNSNSLQAGEGQWYFVKTNPMLWKTKLHKYHCPSLACKLLLLGIIVFGFTAKGIARSQIDDSTCYEKAIITCPLIFVLVKIGLLLSFVTTLLSLPTFP